MIGHSLGGMILADAAGRRPEGWRGLVPLLVAASLPDVDFLFGFVKGNPNLYHHGWTHSLFFTVLAGIAVLIGTRILKGKFLTGPAILTTGILCTHIVIDLLTLDRGAPIGLKLLWPLSNEYMISPVTVFRDVNKASSSADFFGSLFCMHNLWTVFSELGILGFVYGIVLVYKKRRKNAC